MDPITLPFSPPMLPQATAAQEHGPAAFSPPALARRTSDGLQLYRFIPPLFKRTISGDTERAASFLPVLDPAKQRLFQQITLENSQCSFQIAKEQLDSELAKVGITLSEEDNIAIAMTGSDGRSENPHLTGRSFSPIELIICKRTPVPGINPESCQRVEETIEKIRHVIGSPALQGIFSSHIEVKDTSRSSLPVAALSLASKTSIIPTRVLDMQLIHGNQDVLNEVEERLLQEFNQHVVRIGQFNEDFVKSEREILFRQLDRMGGTGGVNLAEGRFTFNLVNSNERGPKYGSMRYLQYSVAYLISKYLTKPSSLEDGVRFLRTLPKRLVDRVQFLREKVIISTNKRGVETRRNLLVLTDQEFEDFSSVYNNLLFWYATLQSRALASDTRASCVQVSPPLMIEILGKAYELGNKICEQAKQLN